MAIAVGALLIGFLVAKFLLKRSLTKRGQDAEEKAKLIIKEAEVNAESIKKDRILQAKEKFHVHGYGLYIEKLLSTILITFFTLPRN